MKWYVWREELGIEPTTFQTLVGCSTVDCEQSLFFFIFSEGSARARETRETRVAARESWWKLQPWVGQLWVDITITSSSRITLIASRSHEYNRDLKIRGLRWWLDLTSKFLRILLKYSLFLSNKVKPSPVCKMIKLLTFDNLFPPLRH